MASFLIGFKGVPLVAKTKTVLKKSKPAVREAKDREEKRQMLNDAIVSGIVNESMNDLMSNKMKYCSHCGEILDTDNFYKSRSHIYKDGKLHICKKCIGELINKYYETYNNLRDVLMIICSITNTMVVKESFEETLKDFSKPKARKSDMFS